MVKSSRISKFALKRLRFGIPFFDEILPEGFPSNSLILISGEGGIAKTLILQNIALSFMKRGFYCIYLCIDEHPLSFYQSMKLMGLRIEIYLKRKKLMLVDLFSYKLGISNSDVEFQEYISVSYPLTQQSLLNLLTYYIKEIYEKNAKVLIIIDSLTELSNRLGINSTIDFIKYLRFEICKKRSIPVFASSHFGMKNYEDFEQSLEYNVDGIIDLRYDPLEMQYGSLVKQLRVRKLRNSIHDNKWHSFSFYKGRIIKLNLENIHQKVSSLNTNI